MEIGICSICSRFFPLTSSFIFLSFGEISHSLTQSRMDSIEWKKSKKGMDKLKGI